MKQFNLIRFGLAAMAAAMLIGPMSVAQAKTNVQDVPPLVVPFEKGGYQVTVVDEAGNPVEVVTATVASPNGSAWVVKIVVKAPEAVTAEVINGFTVSMSGTQQAVNNGTFFMDDPTMKRDYKAGSLMKVSVEPGETVTGNFDGVNPAFVAFGNDDGACVIWNGTPAARDSAGGAIYNSEMTGNAFDASEAWAETALTKTDDYVNPAWLRQFRKMTTGQKPVINRGPCVA